MAAMADDAAPPTPAATVVLLRPGRGAPEILLTQRPSSMAFAGDLFVFPGGRVDAADADERLVERTVSGAAGDGEPPFAIAAIRELFEEAGVLLAERRDGRAPDAAAVAGARRALLAGETTLAAVAEALDLVLRADRLAPISHWTTPPIMPRRFDTRFFAAELPAGAEPSFEAEEVVDHRWLTAARRARGDGRGRDRDVGADVRDAPAARARGRARRDRRPDHARSRARAARRRGAAGARPGSSSAPRAPCPARPRTPTSSGSARSS